MQVGLQGRKSAPLTPTMVHPPFYGSPLRVGEPLGLWHAFPLELALNLFEAALWVVATWLSLRVATLLRGGSLGAAFTRLSYGVALVAVAKVIRVLLATLAGDALEPWFEQGLGWGIWHAVLGCAWIFAGIGAYRLVRAVESI